jgi:hypothetical protein
VTRTAVPDGALPPRPWRGALAVLRGIGKVIHRGLLVVLVLGVVTLWGPPRAMAQPEAKINLKTAKALGLTIRHSLLLRADYTVR